MRSLRLGGAIEMQQPWIIALISTDYDLKDERRTIIDLLKKSGVEISAFEEPDYPVLEGEHSHENCLKALGRADLAILLINERYGGNFYAEKGVSITQKEYEALNIPAVVLVNEKVWDERAVYRKQQKASGMSEEEYADSGKYHPVYVDNVKVFRFIDAVQESYSQNGKSNWINFWRNLDDIKSMLPDLLNSRTATIMRRIVEKQVSVVKRRRTSTALSMSLGDVFDKGYFIEPGYVCTSGVFENSGETLTWAITKRMAQKESCLILGEAGAGKTTLMTKCFLEMVESVKNDPFTIPAYVWLKGMNPDKAFSVEEYLEDACEKFLNKKYYPFFNLSGFKFVFFLDGFDELTEKLSRTELLNLGNSEMFRYPVMLTSRVQYADRYMCGNDFTSNFDFCIKLTEWTQKTAEEYIKHFCEISGKNEAFENQIMVLLVQNDDLHDILKSPLMITILLYVIEQSRMRIPETIRSRTELFEKCLTLLAQREIESKFQKGDKVKIPDNNVLVLHWAYFAWMLYENRLEGEAGISISEAIDKINSIFGKLSVGWPSTVYDVLFDTNADYAFGAFHEQFLEYLVAYVLTYACLNKILPYPDFLKYAMRPEINRYFRSIVSQKPEKERQLVFYHIKELYWQCAGRESENDILERVHAVYHLSRLKVDGADDEISRIFNSEKELAVLQSLYFGVIKRGDLQREKEFYQLLTENADYSNSNRGYHLAYYDSGIAKVTLPYNDDIAMDWGGSLRAFQRHFFSREMEHYYLRRIDLLTMRQFIENRGKREPLNEDILEALEAKVNNPPKGSDEEYQKLVQDEFLKLKQVYMAIEK